MNDKTINENEAIRHEERAQTNADSLRRLLIIINTGGIVIIFLIAGRLLEHNVNPTWALCSVTIFTSGLVLTAISLILAKIREIKRGNAIREGKDPTKFNVMMTSLTWDILSLVLFVSAVVVGIFRLISIEISP